MIPSAAALRNGVKEEQQPHQRGASGLRRPQPSAAHGGSRDVPRPAARAQRRLRAWNKAQGTALGDSRCRCTKNRGRSRSSSRTRGTHLASDGPHLRRPWGLSCCTTPRCSGPATPPCAEDSSGSCPIMRVKEEQQPHQKGASGLRRPQPSAAHGSSCAAPCPAARAQRRLRARNKTQGDDLGASWSR